MILTQKNQNQAINQSINVTRQSPVNQESQSTVNGHSFYAKVEREFVDGSAIAPELFQAAVQIIEDTGRWEPNYALNQRVSTQWQFKPPHSYRAIAAFLQETGDIWQAKPENPRRDKNGKVIKYESVKGSGSRAFLPAIDIATRAKIAQRHGVEVPLHGSFWEWFAQHPEIPRIFDEGGKKALSLLSRGHITIGLFGVDSGAIRNELGELELIADLKPFVQAGTPITLAFDQDTKWETKERVQAALARLGGVLQSHGAVVSVATWDSRDGKGIDDLLVNRGAAAVDHALATAEPLAAAAVFERDRYIQKRMMRFRTDYWELLKRDFILSNPDHVYKGYAPTIDLSHRTILLRGWLGAGKTEAVLRSLFRWDWSKGSPPRKASEFEVVFKSLPRDRQIIWVSGRNGLLAQTGERARQLGFDVYHYQDDPASYREMLRRGCPGIFTLCPDSLKDYAVGTAVWGDVILVIDEFSGVRREILSKSAVMPEFERLLKESGTTIAIDAFLSDVDRRLLAKYRGRRDTVVYDQQFTQSPKRIKWLETRNQQGEISFSHDGISYPLIREWMAAGRKFAIATDSKLVAKALSEFAANHGYQGALVSSETVTSNKAVLPDPDSALAGVKFFIYTPTAQSGLDCQVPFDCGLAIYCGIISPLDFLQMMGRCRQCPEWWVSAARRSLDPACPAPSLDSKRVKGWAAQLAKSFTELEAVTSSQSMGWGLWQSLTQDIKQAFHSEYLQCLLGHFFEAVEVIEVECDRTQWRHDVVQIKRQETKLTLAGNLENGLRLLEQQKAPSNDREVWDVRLAQEYQKYPQIWQGLVNQYKSGLNQDDAIAIAQLLSSRQINKLKHWVQAMGPHASEDLEALQQSVKQYFTSYSSPRWKALQNLSLFQSLNLDRLATAIGKAIAHTTHYRVDSPVIGELWRQFQRSPKLQRLFPTIETITDFWAIVRRCMAFFGYQCVGKSIRVITPGQLHPNGKDRQGRQRFSKSAPLHFSGWLPMAESRSAFFQAYFPVIVEAIHERLNQERKLRAQAEQGRSLSPPIAA